MRARVFLFIITFLTFCAPLSAGAQYHGALQFTTQDSKKKDKAAPSVPKIFSSQVSSVKEAEKLDYIYNSLYVSLWNFAGADFVHQRKLYDLLRFERFKLTRYAAEFETPMSNAMEDLNAHFQKMRDEVDYARQSYADIKEGIREADYQVLDPLWEEKLAEFEKHFEAYFEMQHRFLNTYNNLVKFIIKQGGGYYYKPADRGLYFYRNNAKQYFGMTYDRLRKVSYEQRKLLKSKPPVGVDLTYID